MAAIGIEYIRGFENYNKSNTSQLGALKEFRFFVYGLAKKLLDSKHHHKINFTKPDDQCYEVHLREKEFFGEDDKFADSVDLFMICTHGGNDGDFIVLYYDTEKEVWEGNSASWRLGKKLKWLLLYACSTINKQNPLGLWDTFQNLHLICGAWDLMFVAAADMFTDMGNDVGEMLTDGHTVAEAWIDGLTVESYSGKKTVFQHPMVVCVERRETWRGGDMMFSKTNLNSDHLLGTGFTVPDVSKKDKYWLSWIRKDTFDMSMSSGVPKRGHK